MRLRVLLPDGVFLERDVTKVVAEGVEGSFGILPRHIDTVAALAPGLLAYFDPEARYLALDEGVLVKSGAEVTVCTRRACGEAPLGELKSTVVNEYRVLDDRERRARGAIARLEADFVRRFLELGRPGRT